MFSRYRNYHFEDFTCVHPVSIDSGKTHQKSPAHTSVFRGFFAICVWQIFKTDFTISSPHPTQFTILTCFAYLCSQAKFHRYRREKGVELNMMSPHLSKIREKYIKKILKIGIDYRCVQPVLSKNPTCVIPVSNFWRRWPHDPVSTHG